MAATYRCLPQVQGCAIRIAKLDGSGVPQPGANNMIVSASMTKLTITPVYEDGDEMKEKNACGTVNLDYKGNPSFTRADFELEILNVDPGLIDLISTSDVLATSTEYGNNAPAIGEVVTVNPCSIEVWSRRINNGVVDSTNAYAWWAFPFAKDVKWGAFTFENAPKKLVFQGAMYENANWFNGPTNDWPVASTRVWQWVPVNTIPTTSCVPVAISST